MQVKKRIYAGAVCEQVVYQTEEGTRGISKKNPRPRFKNEEDRADYNRLVSQRHFELLVNANFSTTSVYSTLTCSEGFECHDFIDAIILRDRFWRRMRYAFPDVKAVMTMGRGGATDRIHFHMISDGIPVEDIQRLWTYGKVCGSNLREDCKDRKTGKSMGKDYTGLADYLFKHWTEEQGKGRRYKATTNLKQPEEEEATVCIVQYSEKKPPKAPKGYVYTGDCIITKYGYMRFKYVKEQKPKPAKKRIDLLYRI